MGEPDQRRPAVLSELVDQAAEVAMTWPYQWQFAFTLKLCGLLEPADSIFGVGR